jgi:hypothetical protein
MADQPKPPRLPYDQLRSQVEEDPHARQALDALHATLTDPQAERSNVEHHVGLLRGIPVITTIDRRELAKRQDETRFPISR